MQFNIRKASATSSQDSFPLCKAVHFSLSLMQTHSLLPTHDSYIHFKDNHISSHKLTRSLWAHHCFRPPTLTNVHSVHMTNYQHSDHSFAHSSQFQCHLFLSLVSGTRSTTLRVPFLFPSLSLFLSVSNYVYLYSTIHLSASIGMHKSWLAMCKGLGKEDDRAQLLFLGGKPKAWGRDAKKDTFPWSGGRGGISRVVWEPIEKTHKLCSATGERFPEEVTLPDRWVGVCKTEMGVACEGWREQAVQRHSGRWVVCLGSGERAEVAGGWVVWDGMAGAPDWRDGKDLWAHSPFSPSHPSLSTSKPECPWCSHPRLAQDTGFNLFELTERRSGMETG